MYEGQQLSSISVEVHAIMHNNTLPRSLEVDDLKFEILMRARANLRQLLGGILAKVALFWLPPMVATCAARDSLNLDYLSCIETPYVKQRIFLNTICIHTYTYTWTR